MPKDLNKTLIALIPKTDSATHVSNFKPISLCNLVYKIISKILTSWLQPFMPQMISLYQSTFLKGRLFQENSIMAYEAMHSIKKKRGTGGVMAFEADMAKA